ncbi:unnamed protein product [Vicia faba]|uniref:Transmembrane protein n=1 Tax=Vicia faba TaxID=3906 RepID=A0AAV1AAP3_VICFA|nr:unnamed protein product [Vicia faba]
MDHMVKPRSKSKRALRGPKVTINFVTVYEMTGVETNSLHGLVAFIFFGLLGFLQIRYPDNPTPFQLHPNTTLVSIASFLLYCLAFWVKFKFDTRVDAFMEVFGSLSLVSLVAMLLPDKWELFGYIVIYTIWFICHVIVMAILWFFELRPKLKRLRPLLPNTSTDLS